MTGKAYTRRGFLGLGAAAAVGVGLSACTGSSGNTGGSSGEGSSTLRLFTYEDNATIELLRAETMKFDAENGTTTTVDSLPGSGAAVYPDKLRTELLGGKGPDVWRIWGGKIGAPFATAKQALDLSPYYSQYGWDTKISTPAIEGMTFDGVKSGVPFLVLGIGAWYNKAAFQKAGISAPPASYAELEAANDGFGWKGLEVAGPVVPPADYARFCRYLVARYGARPLVYLVGADGRGDEPQVAAGGAEVHAWDAYGQPTGIHYRPHGVNNHFQDADWLDFQSCQTGHEAEHVQERVADMWRNRPVKAVLNGEPTYEHSGRRGKAEGWWQGDEAWRNLCAGGTMGVVYGAASLWQWRLHPDESGFLPYFLADDAGWRQALDFEGSRYVGLVGRILAGLPLVDMGPDWLSAIAMRALSVPGRFLLCYRANGGLVSVRDDTVSLDYRVVDPRTGEVVAAGTRATHSDPIPDPGGAPRIYISMSRIAWGDDA
jgi:hypothetical protein